MERINRFAREAATMRTVVLLLVSICLSVAIGLATLTAALAPASAAAPRDACAVTAAWRPLQLTNAPCARTTWSSKCCTRALPE